MNSTRENSTKACYWRSLFPVFAIIISFNIAFESCQKNTVSPIPYIQMEYFGLDYGNYNDTPVLFRLPSDTVIMEFTFKDGDGDIGNNDTTKGKYDLYIKDSRFDTGYAGYTFPQIDQSIENKRYGLSGSIVFEFFYPNIINARPDSIHTYVADTAQFELYIMDRAGHKSNHLITSRVIMLP